MRVKPTTLERCLVCDKVM